MFLGLSRVRIDNRSVSPGSCCKPGLAHAVGMPTMLSCDELLFSCRRGSPLLVGIKSDQHTLTDNIAVVFNPPTKGPYTYFPAASPQC